MLTDLRFGLRSTFLQYTAVLVRCLDVEMRPIQDAVASAFLRCEGGRVFLYTCWHVVTGLDPATCIVQSPNMPRRFLQVTFQQRVPISESGHTIGGKQEMITPLYESEIALLRPVWYQDSVSKPHVELNALGLELPLLHDLVKIELKVSADDLASFQLINDSFLLPGGLLDRVVVGEKCFVVGFPYGFSALGEEQPTAIALTRFVASAYLAPRRRTLLMESFGAPGMSGGPVFVERTAGNHIGSFLFGVYTGLVYPDHRNSPRDRNTALGTVADLSEMFATPSWLVPHDKITRAV
jgi:hypothetical protein